MTKNTPVILDRLAEALSRHGVKLKRMQLLQTAAAAFGHRNTHELAAADDAGELDLPIARYMGRTRVDRIGWMHFFQDPDGTVFAVDQDRFDAQQGRSADWTVSPMGNLLDVSSLRRPSETDATSGAKTTEGMYVGGGPPNFTNMCMEIAMPFGEGGAIDPEVPAYMTNGCCEVATVTQKDLETLGLPYGRFDGGFYPLTDDEARYICEDLVDSDDGLHSALVGYAVLYRGTKHLMPTIELSHETAEGHVPSRDEVYAEASAYAERIRPKLIEMGGQVLVDETLADRVTIQLLVPIVSAMEVGDAEAWHDRLAWLMVDPDLPTVNDGRYPLRHQGRGFAVEVSWIGEGEDGDYDPMEPSGTPLLRYDAERLVDGRWEEVPDGSYCTQVPAYCGIGAARDLARYLVDRLEMEAGSHPKRLLEGLSWTTPENVLQWVALERNATTGRTEDFVAQETYGDPDRGTSVDLRRRADGSIRCEVYCDLTAVAVLEARDMAEVRAWLGTLPSDIENGEGRNGPSHALAPQYARVTPDGQAEVRWMLVPKDESEEDWFAGMSDAAPFDRRFVPIERMDV